MAILRARKVWRREPKKPTSIDRLNSLTPEQQRNVLAALRALFVRHGCSWQTVAIAMRVHPKTLSRITRGRNKPNAGLAIRAAQLAGVPVEDVLSGAFGEPGKCPMCGASIPIGT